MCRNYFFKNNNQSYQELCKYGYFDVQGHFREIKNQPLLVKEYAISFPPIQRRSEPLLSLEQYRFNPDYLPVLSQEKRLNTFLLRGKEERIQSIPNILFTDQLIYYHFNNKDSLLAFYKDNKEAIQSIQESDIDDFTDKEKYIIKLALKKYSQILNIRFEEKTLKEVEKQKNTRPICFSKFKNDSYLAADTYLNDPGEYIDISFYFTNDIPNITKEYENSFSQTAMHEISHIFLEHSFFDYSFGIINNSIIKSEDYLQDSLIYSTMSYTYHPIDDMVVLEEKNKILPSGLMHDDILALRYYLSFNPHYQSGDSRYEIKEKDIELSTISDRGGVDIIDYSQHQYAWIDLEKEGFSSGDHLPFQRCIGPFTDIENAKGAKKFSFFKGNDLDNQLIAQNNAVFMSRKGNDTHHEGSGRNQHFIFIGDGQDKIISQSGQSDIHLMGFHKDGFVLVEKENSFTLVYAATNDHILYQADKALEPKKIRFHIENKRYFLSDFTKREMFLESDQPQMHSGKVLYQPKADLQLSKIIKNISLNERVVVTDLSNMKGSARIKNNKTGEFLVKGESLHATLEDIAIIAADGKKDCIDYIKISSANMKYSSTFPLFTTSYQPIYQQSNQMLVGQEAIPFSVFLQVTHPEGQKPIYLTIKSNDFSQFSFQADAKKMIKTEDIIKFQDVDLKDISISSNNQSKQKVRGMFECIYHYDGYSSKPFTLSLSQIAKFK